MEKEIKRRLAEMSKMIAQQDKSLYGNRSLLTGTSGLMLFQLYYQRFIDQPNDKLEEALVDHITAEIESPISSTTFCNGSAGFAWFLHHLNAENFIELDESLFVQYDELVVEHALKSFDEQNHDYLHGALGQMIYLAERLKVNKGLYKQLEILVDKLLGASSENEIGIYWKETPVMLEEHEKNKEIINLHISHGQASKIMLFVKLFEAGFNGAERILKSTIKYLLASKIGMDEQFVIPDRIVDAEKSPFTHLGWCRGNLSIGLALFNAAHVLGDDLLKQDAEEIAVQTLQLDTMEKARIRDYAVCHGTSGLSHMYNRIFEYTEDTRFQKAAERWMTYTLEASFEDGIGQFKSWNAISQKWINDFGLLSGASGIGLVLIGYLTPENRLWDASFLLR